MKTPIDNTKLKEIQLACAEVIAPRENMLEERAIFWMARLLFRNCKLYICLSLLSLLLLFGVLYMNIATFNYISIYIFMGVLGICAIVELGKEYRYQVGEIYMPTRIGGAKVISYTLVVLSFIQVLCFIVVILCGFMYYALDFYKLLWLTAIPCFIVNGITLRMVAYYPSMHSSVLCYFLLYVMYYVIFHNLYQYIHIEAISMIMIVGVCIYYIKCCVQFQTFMNKKGGYLLWN